MVGRGGVGDQLPTFDTNSKSTKIPNSLYSGDEGLLVTNFQLLILSPNLLKSQNPYTALMLSSNLLKSQIPYTVWGQPTFSF